MSGRFRLFFSGLSLFMLLVLFFTVFGERGLLHLQRLRQENRTLEEHIFILMHKNRELRSHIMQLRTDDDFLEKVAREELGLAKKGEIIYRFRRRGELSEASVSELSFSSVNERSEWSPQSGQRSERSLLKASKRRGKASLGHP